jgi:hypothetical protein
MPEGCIAVVDAMGVTDAGIFGDILCARMRKRGVAALVTDGVLRDLAGVLDTGLPVWCVGRRPRRRRSPASPSSAGRSRSAAAASRCSRTTWWWPTATARSLIPAALVEEVVAAARRAGAARSVDHGGGRARRGLPGLYPPNAETKARYEAAKAGTD